MCERTSDRKSKYVNVKSREEVVLGISGCHEGCSSGRGLELERDGQTQIREPSVSHC